MTEIERTLVIDQARAELRSAYTLVADPQCDLQTALPHLRRAWRAIAWLSQASVPDRAGDDLDGWLAPEHLALLKPSVRTPLHATLELAHEREHAPEPWAAGATEPASDRELGLPSGRVLVAQLRALGKVLDAIELQARGRPLKAQTALRWATRVTVALVSVSAFGLLALRPWQSEDVGPWRAEYYPSQDLEGEPEIRREVDIAFDWKLEPPTESIPSDTFSARYDTCLILEEKVDAAFMLVSDDGARLFVDGKQVINNWSKSRVGKTRGVKGGKVSLKAGVHHLRVEYHERERNAKLHLTASFDKEEAPQPISAHMLEFPKDYDEDDPCAGVND